MNYTPDKWVIIHIKDTDIKKVLAGWSGGYLYGGSWRMSSGITNIIEEGDNNQGEYYLIENESGSVYKCYKGSQGMNMASAEIYEEIKDKVDLIDIKNIL